MTLGHVQEGRRPRHLPVVGQNLSFPVYDIMVKVSKVSWTGRRPAIALQTYLLRIVVDLASDLVTPFP